MHWIILGIIVAVQGLRVAILTSKMRLKITMKLLSFFGIEISGCLNIDNILGTIVKGKQAKFGKISHFQRLKSC